MSDELRGRVWSEIAKAAHAMPNYETTTEEAWLATGDTLAAEAADAILALVADALTSDAAVEAIALLDMSPDEFRGITKRMHQGIFAMNTPNPRVKTDLRGAYRHAIPHVLAAAGVTQEDER